MVSALDSGTSSPGLNHAGDIVLCSWARHFTLTVPLFTQVNKWVPVNLMLGVTLQWTSILWNTRLECRNVEIKSN